MVVIDWLVKTCVGYYRGAAIKTPSLRMLGALVMLTLPVPKKVPEKELGPTAFTVALLLVLGYEEATS